MMNPLHLLQPSWTKSCGRQRAGKGAGHGRMKWKATQTALGKEGRGWKQLKPGEVKQKGKFGLIYQPHLRTSCVCIVTPVSLRARNSTRKEPCLGFEAFQLWLSALQSLIKCPWQRMSSSEGRGRCAALKHCPGNLHWVCRTSSVCKLELLYLAKPWFKNDN